MRTSPRVILLFSSLLLSCGQADDDNPVAAVAGIGGQPAEGAAGASDDAGGEAGAPISGGAAGLAGAPSGAAGSAGAAGFIGSPADFETIDQCPESACGTSSAQIIEGSTRFFDRDPAVCVLSALRDRTPGLYRHTAGAAWSSGSSGIEHLVLITSDSQVVHVQHNHVHDSLHEPIPDVYSDAERCTPREPDFFQACIDAIESAEMGAAWDCLYGTNGGATFPGELGWFTSCDAGEARCD